MAIITFSRLQGSQVTGWCCLVFWVWCVVLQNFSVMLYYPHLSLFAHLFAERFHVTVFVPVIIVACYPELCLWDRAGFSFVLVQTQSWLDPTGISGRTFLAFLLSLPCDGQTPSYICDWSWAGISFFLPCSSTFLLLLVQDPWPKTFPSPTMAEGCFFCLYILKAPGYLCLCLRA